VFILQAIDNNGKPVRIARLDDRNDARFIKSTLERFLAESDSADVAGTMGNRWFMGLPNDERIIMNLNKAYFTFGMLSSTTSMPK
jgi:hypothetical protein